MLRLKKTGIPLQDWNGSNAVIAATDRQTKKVITLTWVLVVLTVALVIGLGVQIWLTLRPHNTVDQEQKQEIQLLKEQLQQLRTLNQHH